MGKGETVGSDSEGEYLMAAGTERDIWDAEPRVILTVLKKMGKEDSVGKTGFRT